MGRRGVATQFSGALGVVLLLSGCSHPPEISVPTAPSTPAESLPTHSPERTQPDQDIASGLNSPWSITFAGDTPLLSERDSGRIIELDSAGRTRSIGEVTDVHFGAEGGLLGLAFDEPDQLFAYSTGTAGNRIQRFTLRGAPGNFQLTEPRTVIDALPAGRIHNGGRIAFGPDGMLYAGVGDTGDTALAQDLSSMGGKILRMTPEGKVPPDNPFSDSLVYSYGHRNVQGLAWDSQGNLYASEFGQNTWDELNLITAAGNYGWPEAEGRVDSSRPLIDPIAQWSPEEASPSGIAIKDDVLYLANLRGQRIRSVELANPQNQAELWEATHGRFRDIVLSPDGTLWALTNNTDGRGTPAADGDRILPLDPAWFLTSDPPTPG